MWMDLWRNVNQSLLPSFFAFLFQRAGLWLTLPCGDINSSRWQVLRIIHHQLGAALDRQGAYPQTGESRYRWLAMSVTSLLSLSKRHPQHRRRQ